MIPDRKVDYLRPDLDSRVSISSFRFSPFYRPLRQARDCWEVTRRIHELRPDVVHLQQGHHMFNLFLRRLRRYPLVVTIHEPSERRARHGRHRRPQAIIDRGFRRASRVILHGEALRSAAAERGVDPSVIHVIPRPAPRGGEVVAREDSATVLFFGRIWPYKGLEYLIEAEPLVAAAVPGLRTVIAGEGEGMARYRRLIRDPARFDVRNSFVSRELRDELFAKASVVVLPYVDASTSAVVPVAYLYGKPVVVTSAGGLTDDVDPGRTGLVVPPRDHIALAAALIRVLRDEGFRQELGRAGRRKLEVEFAPDLIARKTLEVYALARNGSISARSPAPDATCGKPGGPWPNVGRKHASSGGSGA
jgi:glycosyltransferase involved in cell wall biosynthesis